MTTTKPKRKNKKNIKQRARLDEIFFEIYLILRIPVSVGEWKAHKMFKNVLLVLIVLNHIVCDQMTSQQQEQTTTTTTTITTTTTTTATATATITPTTMVEQQRQ